MAPDSIGQVTIKARFRIRLPDDSWIAEISQEFPDATFRLLTGLRTAEGAIELGEVVAENPERVSASVANHPALVDYHQLDLTDNRSLSRYESTETAFYDFAEQASLTPEYPITVQNGWFVCDMTATHDEFASFRTQMEHSDLPFELLSRVEFTSDDGLLTDRQHQVMEAALQAGYFEVPRECTLADLADRLDIDKSTASETFRRADAKILKWYLTGTAVDRSHR